MKSIHLDTFCTHRSDRAAHWAEINHRYFGELDVDQMDTRSVEAQLDFYSLSALQLYLIGAPAHRVSRVKRPVSDSLDDSYKLMLQIQGHADLEIGDRHFHLMPGDWSLYDPRAPYSIHNHEEAQLMVVKIPRARLAGLQVPELHTCEAPQNDGAGLSAMLGGILRSLSQQLPALPDDAGAAISESILGLLTYTLARHQTGLKERALPQAVLQSRIREYIQQHLTEHDLSIDRIADAMRCSKRYVHRAFEENQESVDRYIWRSRLAVARQRMAAPQYAHNTLAQIADACGFSSPAHFSKLVKREFNASPSALRKSLLGQ